MKITDYIAQSEKTLFSIEILPPKKGDNISALFNNLEPLMKLDPAFIDVTYHREEYVYRQKSGGLLEKIVTRKRPGTVGICAAIKSKFDIDTVPHIICGGFNKEETENALIDLDFLGIDNIMVLRGDSIKSEPKFIAKEGGHHYASELLQQVVNMNNGVYLDENIQSEASSSFCIGVAGYPEKHIEAPSYKSDMKYLKKKVDLGADYIVTQMFFDNQKYFDFVDRCRAEGITIPIIPGLKPLTTLNHITSLPKTFYLDMPEELTDNLEDCKTNKDAKKVGTEWCIKQSQELLEAGAPCIHYYTMGHSDPIFQIGKETFGL